MTENEIREQQMLSVAQAMMTAARTAPKGCGIDKLEIAVLTGDEIGKLAGKMREVGERDNRSFFLRDAANVEASQAIVIMGCHNAVRGLNCGLCGYPTCREKKELAPNTLCSFVITDLGIALGSAVSIAADFRVDNRIMYSAGVAAGELGFMPECPMIYAVPISACGKSVYFDRSDKCAK